VGGCAAAPARGQTAATGDPGDLVPVRPARAATGDPATWSIGATRESGGDQGDQEVGGGRLAGGEAAGGARAGRAATAVAPTVAGEGGAPGWDRTWGGSGDI
jgi:hypothetical protein